MLHEKLRNLGGSCRAGQCKWTVYLRTQHFSTLPICKTHSIFHFITVCYITFSFYCKILPALKSPYQSNSTLKMFSISMLTLPSPCGKNVVFPWVRVRVAAHAATRAIPQFQCKSALRQRFLPAARGRHRAKACFMHCPGRATAWRDPALARAGPRRTKACCHPGQTRGNLDGVCMLRYYNA